MKASIHILKKASALFIPVCIPGQRLGGVAYESLVKRANACFNCSV